MTDQKQLEDVKHFNCLDSMIRNDTRYTREMKSRLVMAETAFKRKKTLFTSKLDVNSRKKLVKC
jgi:hypothetical protein